MALNVGTIDVEVEIPLWVKLLARFSLRAAIRHGYVWMRFPRGGWVRVAIHNYL